MLTVGGVYALSMGLCALLLNIPENISMVIDRCGPSHKGTHAL